MPDLLWVIGGADHDVEIFNRERHQTQIKTGEATRKAGEDKERHPLESHRIRTITALLRHVVSRCCRVRTPRKGGHATVLPNSWPREEFDSERRMVIPLLQYRYTASRTE